MMKINLSTKIKSRTFLAVLGIFLVGLLVTGYFVFRGEFRKAPSEKFDLTGWKLQIPGPKDIKNLEGYASKYFYLNDQNEMTFWLNTAETGATPNSSYVRSELRHLDEWTVDKNQTLSATLKLHSKANPNRVTVLQIHGIADDGGNAPPLLRMAVEDDCLYAVIKLDRTGFNAERVELLENVGEKEFSCDIQLLNKRMIIRVNGVEKFNRSMEYWQWKNYFKAGCYPQAHEGIVILEFKKLEVK